MISGVGCGPRPEGIAPRATTDRLELPEELGAWAADGETQVFSGDELFMYMNGGAEIYHEYGFAELTVREYARGEDRISVEVYRMDGTAYGIYTYARSAAGAPVDIGSEGALAEYYLTFWSGSYLVVVTLQTELEDARAAVLELAQQLGDRFPATGAVPGLMSELPAEGQIDGTQTYLVGPICLNNLAPSAARLFSGFVEGACARYGSPDAPQRLEILLRWSDPNATSTALDRADEIAAVELGRGLVTNQDGEQHMRTKDGHEIAVRQEAEVLRLTIQEAGAGE